MHIIQLILKLKIFIKEYLYLGLINKIRFAPRKLVSIKEYSENPQKYKFQIREIIPGYVSEIDLDKKLFEICSIEFPNYKKANIESVYFIKVTNGRMMTDGCDLAVIDQGGYLISNFSYHFEENLSLYIPEKNNFFSKKVYYPPKKIAGNIFSMYQGGGGNNYFHFLFDSLATLKVLEISGMKGDIDYYYLHESRHKFQKEALTLLGINENKIIEATKHPHITAENIFCSTHPGQPVHIPYWIIQFLRDSFLKFRKEKNAYKKVFLSRKDSRQRRLLNEDAVFEQLEKLGFKRLVLSELNFIDQVSIFATAEVVISPHSAGLANLVFGNKNCKVIQLFGGKNEWPLYHALAVRMGMNYHFLTAEKSENNNKRNYSDFYINPDEIVNLL